MTGVVSVFGAPFFVSKGWFISQLAEDNGHGLTVPDFGFRFDAVLVAGGSIVVLRQAFMGNDPSLAVLADAENGLLGTQRALRGIEKYVLLEGTRCYFVEADGKQFPLQCLAIGNTEFDLDLDGAHAYRVQRAGPGRRGRDGPVKSTYIVHFVQGFRDLYSVIVRTIHLKVSSGEIASEAARSTLEQAAAILREGGTVAFPTETVYGLGANALDATAVAKIFAAKQRPSWDPLIVHVADMEMLWRVAKNVPEAAHRLAERFWPGPLTLLLEKKDEVPDEVTAGRRKIGVRMPQHPVAQALIRRAGVPVAAPSANRFGRTSPTSAAHVVEDLDGRIDAVLDAGETWHGLESTVIDAVETPCVVYRPGVVSLEQIRAAGVEAVGFREPEKLHETPPEALPSPGVGLRHYAPKAKLILVDGEGEAQIAAFVDAVERARHQGMKTGLMLPDVFAARLRTEDMAVFDWGRWERAEELAQRLFAGLRFLDQAGAEVILCPVPKAEGIGIAIRDRLRKAAR